MELRPSREGDDVGAVIEAAFGERRVVDVWADVAAGPHLRASLVADDGGTVVGHVGLSHAWLDARRALVDVWMLSPLSVLPSRQREGIGAALVAAAVAAARSSGAPMLVLEGSPAYYGPRGFAPASAYDVQPATPRTPAPACQVVVYDAREDWMTGRLVYPDAWWRHDCAGLRDPQLTEVERLLG